MNKSLFTLVLAIIFASCAEKEKIDDSVDYAILSGTIKNASSEEITIKNLFDSDFEHEIVLDENGKFSDTVKLSENDLYTLIEGKSRIPLFLQEGDVITVNFDADNLDPTLEFSGERSSISNYYYKKKRIGLKKGEDARNAMMRIYSLDEVDFIAAITSTKSEQEALVSKTDNFSDELIKKELANIEYGFQSILFNYERAHAYVTSNTNFNASNKFKSRIKEISFENEDDFNFSESYRSLLNASLMSHVQDEVEKDALLEYGNVYLDAVNAKVKNQTIKDKLAYDNAKNGITYARDTKKYYDIYLKTSSNTAYNDKITELYTKISALAKGSASPKFKDYENNAGGTTSLDDLKGKYVYIDVWATWCGPCKKEIPFLKEIEEQFHDKNIEFVSISVDKKEDHDAWKNMITDKDLGGIQLFADNDWKSQFVEGYMIKGIPRFILIDPAGNIVQANAPKPSSEQLVALFEEVGL